MINNKKKALIPLVERNIGVYKIRNSNSKSKTQEQEENWKEGTLLLSVSP